MFVFKWLNSQISPQRFTENAIKPSTFYCININPQCIIFLKLKPKTFKNIKLCPYPKTFISNMRSTFDKNDFFFQVLGFNYKKNKMLRVYIDTIKR